MTKHKLAKEGERDFSKRKRVPIFNRKKIRLLSSDDFIMLKFHNAPLTEEMAYGLHNELQLY